MSGDPIELGAAALAEAKAFLRVRHDDEDALIAELLRSAAELFEQFSGQALIERDFREWIACSTAWTRLGSAPVLEIAAVEHVPPRGSPAALPAEAYAVDIDANSEGWVRTLQKPGTGRLRVTCRAGLATEWDALPEAVRQGVVRLAAYLYGDRSGEGVGPPAAVTALWRPWRRLRVR